MISSPDNTAVSVQISMEQSACWRICFQCSPGRSLVTMTRRFPPGLTVIHSFSDMPRTFPSGDLDRVALLHGEGHHRLLHVQPVLGLVEHPAPMSVDDAIGHFDVAVGRERVHVYGV